MDFALSTEQQILQATVRAFLAHEVGVSVVREFMETERSGDPSTWQRIVALGWHTMLVPSAHGGLGLDTIDMVAVAEELGRALHGGPLLASSFLATSLACALGCDELVAQLARGTHTATIAVEEVGHGDPLACIQTTATATGSPPTYLLNGTKMLVIDGHLADTVIVAARVAPAHTSGADSSTPTPAELATFLVTRADVPAATFVATPTLDLTRSFATAIFHDTPATRVTSNEIANDHTTIWRDALDFAALALSAELVGVAQAASALALEYARTREVFGQPLTKFQVTRHKAVDLLRETELARVGVHNAAWAWATHDPNRTTAVAMAKSYAAEAANHVGAECIQIHGAMGYTWDCDAHLYLRRAKVNDVLFGTQAWHRTRVADNYFSSTMTT